MNEPTIVQESIQDGRRLIVTWMPASFVPPRELTTQALGLCFTEHRKIVLVAGADRQWTLPGGHPQDGESPEEALARAVWEEACARVVRSQYLGCQRVDDPGHPDGPQTYYQSQFWARVELYPFKPRLETSARTLVEVDALLSTLFWGSSPMAKIVFEQGLAVENRNGSACI